MQIDLETLLSRSIKQQKNEKLQLKKPLKSTVKNKFLNILMQYYKAEESDL